MKLISYLCVLIMKVRLVTINTVRNYRIRNAGSRAAFATWLTALNNADWETLNDVKETYNSADIIGENRIVFNIGGNNYRMICTYHFGEQMVHLYIKWIGTHAEYDRLCANNEQYTVSKY